MKRCYLASPFGFTEAGRYYYREIYVPALAIVAEPVDPWCSVEDFSPGALIGREAALAVGRRNTEAIRSCSLLVAYLDGQELDSGTVAEIGYAAALELTCFGLRTDLRQNGESGCSVNLQVEAFIELTGGRITGSLEELIAAIR